MVETGAQAVDFTGATDGGHAVTLRALRGKPVILYFYPKDNTPGCATEAGDFRDAMPRIAKHGAAVIGVSRDSVRKHDNFKAKHDLNFTLVSDESGAICEAYGVWVEKKLYGRVYMGVERATFLIDGAGVLRQTWRKVQVKGHVVAVVDALDNL